jgi:hypothetical protein
LDTIQQRAVKAKGWFGALPAERVSPRRQRPDQPVMAPDVRLKVERCGKYHGLVDLARTALNRRSTFASREASSRTV